MPQRLRVVIERRHLGGQSLSEIGRVLGLSRERIRQLETQALHALTLRLRGGVLRPPSTPEASEWVTEKEAAAIIGRSRSWVATSRARGRVRMRARTFRRKVLLLRADVERIARERGRSA